MKTREDLIKDVEIGTKIFIELFELLDEDLKIKLKSIIDNNVGLDILKDNPDIFRSIRNEEPENIKIWFYDGLIIDWSGISIKPEHGPEYKIVKFNKHFKL